ncbi:hypothetical protein B0T20DRAFT_264594 [Sordaria brevicollis]|uniref:Uncharacterized protein n=1 Tax=Sordaria brevicollis TaxID=83679 RepID=A0AAE0U9W9_SORBR|nr:hypothetical protein B0T20DRAFT_264594 [Sordaria brevicollis]
MSRYFGNSGYTGPSRNRGREYEYRYSPEPYRNARTEYAYSPSPPTVRYRQSPDSFYSPRPRRPASGTYGGSSYIESPTRPRAPRARIIDDLDYDADQSDQWSDTDARRPSRCGGYGFNATLPSGDRDDDSEYSGEIPYQRRGRSPVRRCLTPSPPPRRQNNPFGRRSPVQRWSTPSPPPRRQNNPVERWITPSPPPRRQNNPSGRRSFREDDDSFGNRRSGSWRGSSPSPPPRNTGRGRAQRRFTTYTYDDDEPIRGPRGPDPGAAGGWSRYFEEEQPSRYYGYW